MAKINNLQLYQQTIEALAPIDGVAADGRIYFRPEATPAQIAAANVAAATYTDVAPQIVAIEALLALMTDPEYTALITQAQSRPALHRIIFAARRLDLALPAVQTLINNLVTAGVFTAQRAQVIFAPPPAHPDPVVTPVPAPTSAL